MSIVLVLLLLVLMLGLAGVVLAVVVPVLLVRAAVQAVQALLGRPRPTALGWGPAGAVLPAVPHEITVLRREMARDVEGSCQAVQAGLRAGRPVQPLAALAERLRRAAAALDLDLAVVAGGPRELLDAQLARVREVRTCCTSLRSAVVLAGAAASGPELAVLAAELGAQVDRLGHWSRAHDELGRPSPAW